MEKQQLSLSSIGDVDIYKSLHKLCKFPNFFFVSIENVKREKEKYKRTPKLILMSLLFEMEWITVKD